VIRQVAWSAEASDRLARALPGAVRDLVAREVLTNVAQLWECTDDTPIARAGQPGEVTLSGRSPAKVSPHHSAYVVTRIDVNPLELVVVAYEGSGMMHFGPHFVNWARDRGIPCRAHVTSPVVERLLRKLKLFRSEVILRTAA